MSLHTSAWSTGFPQTRGIYTPWGIIPGMCRQVACKRCEKASWAGCGQHVNQVLAGVPKNQRCKCTAQEKADWKKQHSFLGRVFGRTRS